MRALAASVIAFGIAAPTVASDCAPIFQQKLVDQGLVPFDSFGDAVAIDGDRALIGAWGDDTNGALAGAAYVYQRVGNAWQRTAKLLAPDGASDARFGTAVAIRGNWAVVGAAHHDGFAQNAGAIYVYRLVGGSWVFSQKILSPDPEQFAFFGFSVSTDGTRIAVGSYFEDVTVNGTNYASNGAAYVFTLAVGGPNDGNFVHEATVVQNDPQSSSWFGYGVSIDGSLLAVGAPQTLKPGFQFGPGAVYFFERTAGTTTWVQKGKHYSPDTTPTERFGRSVALSGSRAVVGAPKHASAGAPHGAAYAFARNANGSWSLDQKLAPVGIEQSSDFGERVAIHGDRILCGAPYASIAGMPARGNAWLFRRSAGGWGNGTKILAADPAANDSFGKAVGISADWIIVGRPFDDDMGGDSGTASIYRHGCPDQTCAPDLDGSGAVDAADLAILLGQWGVSGSADLDGSGVVNGADLAIMLGAWGSCGG